MLFLSDKSYPEAKLTEAFGGFIHSLVGNEIIGNGDDGAFQILCLLMILFNEFIPRLLYYDFYSKIR